MGRDNEPHETDADRTTSRPGIFIERVLRPARRQSNFNGDYNFQSNAANPFDTNYSFANALLGSINSYTESTSRPFAEGRFNQIEFFGQDNWRLSRRVTLDLGMRFVHIGATYVAGQQVSYFDPAAVRARQRAKAVSARLPGHPDDVRRWNPRGA